MTIKTIKGKKYEVNSSGVHRQIKTVKPLAETVLEPEISLVDVPSTTLPLPEKPITKAKQGVHKKKQYK